MASYFTNNRRGEIPELETELNSTKFERKREAVKKIIAAMTVGKDVSNLFPHVVKCMETDNLELKKLVYLYIINYAKSQPDLALMAVNSFRKDSRQTSNPLIRALAVRTMGCLRVEKITEYLCEPLKDALQDDDPYVRKTAAICVAKLYDSAPALVEEYELIDLLNGLLVDGNAMVVANAVISLKEISKMRGSNVVVLDNNTISKLVAAMNECTEWGQAFILETIGDYNPVDVREAETIIERVAPRLAHANSAVILGSVRVIIKYMDYLTSTESIRNWCRKLTPPLVTLLSAEPEIQYVALKNINLIVQKRPNILDKEIRVFFCKYNDPVYIKMEKVDIMIRLADNKNIDQVLHEFKEYATEVDVDFVKKSVRAVGRCAIKLERAAERCVQCLLDLIMLRVNYVVQEAVIVIKDIFRKYPNRYEMIIKDLFEQLESLDDPEAKSSMIWIIGEYAERIDDADSQLSNFLQNFNDEPSQVQLALLTATVKLFLKKPDEAEGMITQLLTMATEECLNPDLRDRAYIYWRLLSTDPEVTKQVVLGEKPTISDDAGMIDSQILDKLIEQLASLSSIYHKPAESFIQYTREQQLDEPEAPEEQYVYDDSTGQTGQTEFYGIGMQEGNDYMGDLLGFDEEPKKAKVPYQTVLSSDTPGQGGRPGV